MASLFQRRNQFWVCYYVNGKRIQRSLKTDNERIARDKVNLVQFRDFSTISFGHIVSHIVL